MSGCLRVVGPSAVVIVQAISVKIYSTSSEADSVNVSLCSVRASWRIFYAPEEILSNCKAISILVWVAAIQGVIIGNPFGIVFLLVQSLRNSWCPLVLWKRPACSLV